MNNFMKIHSVVAGVVATSILAVAAPVFAQVGATAAVNASVGVKGVVNADVKAKADAKIAERMTKAKDRAGQEIGRRTDGLTKLSARINDMKHISAEQKASLSASISAQIDALASLKTKVDADTEVDVLTTDLQSITQSYRIYALVMPQVSLIAAADRANELAVSFTDVDTKLDARIDAAKTAGKDVAAVAKLRADIDTKLADSKVQSDAAVALVAGLTPDNGDKTKADANHKALVDAQAKIKAANTDLKAAREDVRKITVAIKGMKIEAKANATSTTTVGN